eukprot:CAMPEP_0115493738 /NCGR_PEP_ID=MMETSP0271-20121206/64351_1 /TAXON_ID=71861 /ORGANISM="Scrippsiella trochoidea, Strain CCMP3099" /LENGTH=104 /DNA_ID=CAMNT_0002922279 /DNA_START=68 /DNA_END=380 /DNA_ORIENTATION=+
MSSDGRPWPPQLWSVHGRAPYATPRRGFNGGNFDGVGGATDVDATAADDWPPAWLPAWPPTRSSAASSRAAEGAQTRRPEPSVPKQASGWGHVVRHEWRERGPG